MPGSEFVWGASADDGRWEYPENPKRTPLITFTAPAVHAAVVVGPDGEIVRPPGCPACGCEGHP